MNLVKHARRELILCGQYEEDPEYSESIIEAVKAFASYGHSGASAMIAREQLYALLAFRTLSPLTSDPEEWLDQSEASGKPMWQNKRDPSIFSEDGGKTWKSVDKDNPVNILKKKTKKVWIVSRVNPFAFGQAGNVIEGVYRSKKQAMIHASSNVWLIASRYSVNGGSGCWEK